VSPQPLPASELELQQESDPAIAWSEIAPDKFDAICRDDVSAHALGVGRFDGAGPAHLAQAILQDRLGYTPPSDTCRAFARDVIAKLPSDFELPGTEVDEWIAAAEQTID